MGVENMKVRLSRAFVGVQLDIKHPELRLVHRKASVNFSSNINLLLQQDGSCLVLMFSPPLY